jgi:hypothetical protein
MNLGVVPEMEIIEEQKDEIRIKQGTHHRKLERLSITYFIGT